MSHQASFTLRGRNPDVLTCIAGKNAIGKPKGTQLRVSVTAAPLAGKATDHMVRFLAPLFGVAVADIEVVFGRENVNKQLRVQAPKKLPAAFLPPVP